MKIMPDAARQLIQDRLVSIGVNSEHAATVAEVSVAADLRGITSHGTKMLPAYVDRVRGGGILPNGEPSASTTVAGVYLVDGAGVFGQVAANWAANLIIDGVRKGELRVASIRNTNHCGMLAYYTEKIAQQGGIAFMACNTNPNVAAFGGTEKVLGTNPFSIAAPCGSESIVIDMATSSVAKGKIYEYDKKGIPIPIDWALDGAGNPTTDAGEALKGALLPFAGHKGYAISLAVEMLAGVVSGAGYSHSVKSLHNNAGDVQDVGIFLMGIPVTAFMSLEEYNERILDLAATIKGSNRSGGDVYLPGELEHRLRLERMRNGIEVDDDIVRLLMTDREE